MDAISWAWVPITLGAAFAQTLRNAAQRHLTGDLGALGATLVRFLYGLPFAALWLVVAWLGFAKEGPWPAINVTFLIWTVVAALSQIAATALLLRNMEERNFAIGVAYSKSEIIQVAIFGLVLLGDRVSAIAVVSIVIASIAVMLLSLPAGNRSLGAIARGWASRSAMLGLGSGAAFGMAAVGYRGAALALATPSVVFAAAESLVWAQTFQTVLLGGYLACRQWPVIVEVVRTWRVSLLAGAMGAIGSACWFTAMAMQPVARVRTLGLIELYFSYMVSRRIFRERLGGAELAGLVLLAAGLVGIVGLR
ncbi:MAG TPA: EamA/RhaT family transporter [Stellaceae bacterium]|jgi:drug/metabolite transporter (DMT)-like permease|nr:EamA/RhaT family transporter [Stellaceae bacterium]